jgi:hypothetical protein
MNRETAKKVIMGEVQKQLDAIYQGIEGKDTVGHGFKYWEPKNGNTAPRIYITYYAPKHYPKKVGYLSLEEDAIGMAVNANWHDRIEKLLKDNGLETKML